LIPGIDPKIESFLLLLFKEEGVTGLFPEETGLEDCHVAKLGLAVASPQLAGLAMTALWPASSPKAEGFRGVSEKTRGSPRCGAPGRSFSSRAGQKKQGAKIPLPREKGDCVFLC